MSFGVKKVVWAEGVFLGQQHFQQWDHYHEQSQHLRSKNLTVFDWGLSKLEIDLDALKHGLFRIKECSGLFSNGQLIHFNMLDADTLVFDLTKINADKIELYLCLPANTSISGIAGYPNPNYLCAWQADYRKTIDQYDMNNEREIMFARPNLLLMNGAENLTQLINFKIAELHRVDVNQYQLNEKFIPPLLRISGSYSLKNMLRRLVELTEAKVRILFERRNQFNASVTDFSQNNLAQFLLLQALSAALPELKHCLKQVEFHPERLYSLLIRIAGQLNAFSQETETTAELPSYQHEKLADTFLQLETILMKLFDVILPVKMAALKLQRESDTLYTLDNIDSNLLQKNSFFIAVYLAADDSSWIANFAQHVKISSREKIEMIVISALPGVSLTHLQRTPSKLPVKSGYEYFRLENYGDFWQDIVKDKSLGMFVSQEFIDAKFEILTIEE